MGKKKDLEMLTEQRNIIPFESKFKNGFYEIKIDKELHEKILELLSMVNKLTDVSKENK